MQEEPVSLMDEIRQIDVAYCSGKITLAEAKKKLYELMDIFGVALVLDDISPTLRNELVSSKAKTPIH